MIIQFLINKYGYNEYVEFKKKWKKQNFEKQKLNKQNFGKNRVEIREKIKQIFRALIVLLMPTIT